MPKIKRSTSQVADSGFSIYAGDNPRPGAYRGEIKQCKVRQSSSSGNQYYNVLVELQGNEGTKAQFDGFPSWCMLTMTDKEANLRREKNFYRAVCGNEDPTIVFKEIKDGGDVTTIGGKKPIGTKVIVNIKNEDYQGTMQSKGDEIFPSAAANTEPAEPDEPEDDDDDLDADEDEVVEVETDEDVDVEFENRTEELNALSVVKLRRAAKALEIDVAGMDKEGLVEAILEAEFPAEDAEAEEDADADEEEGPTYEEFSAMTLVKLKKAVLAAFSDSYDPEDLADLKKPEILEMLVDDELVDAPAAF